jgi:hypothetical protein
MYLDNQDGLFEKGNGYGTDDGHIIEGKTRNDLHRYVSTFEDTHQAKLGTIKQLQKRKKIQRYKESCPHVLTHPRIHPADNCPERPTNQQRTRKIRYYSKAPTNLLTREHLNP